MVLLTLLVICAAGIVLWWLLRIAYRAWFRWQDRHR